MALSQLRPMVVEGDRPARSQSEFTRLPDGSLIMVGRKPVEARPGVLAGLKNFIASKISPQPAQDRWWIPQAAEPAPAVSVPVAQPMAPTLPSYNEWQEIEEEAVKEQRIKEQLGDVSNRIMNSPQIIEGKWFR